MMTLDQLPTFDDLGILRMVVESPKGSTLKLKYEPSLKAFLVKRALPQGPAFPTIGDLSRGLSERMAIPLMPSMARPLRSRRSP